MLASRDSTAAVGVARRRLRHVARHVHTRRPCPWPDAADALSPQLRQSSRRGARAARPGAALSSAVGATGTRDALLARALRCLATTMLEPGMARPIYDAVLRQALLAPLFALWRSSSAAGGDGPARESARVAAVNVMTMMLYTNLRDCDAALRCYIVADPGAMVRVGIPDARTATPLVDATGRLALVFYRSAAHCVSDVPWARSMAHSSGALYACMAPWPAQRVQQELLQDMASQPDLTILSRSYVMVCWIGHNLLTATMWDSWCGAVARVCTREISLPPHRHPLAALVDRLGSPAGALPPEARAIAVAYSDPAQIRHTLLNCLQYGYSNRGINARARTRAMDESGLYAFTLRVVKLAARHVHDAPPRSLDYGLVQHSCAAIQAHVSVSPTASGEATESLAAVLLAVAEWGEAPSFRSDGTAQGAAAMAAAALVGSREGDGAEGVALSEVGCPP